MNRFTLKKTALLFSVVIFAPTLPQAGLAQGVSPMLIGTWKLNLAKSTYSRGPAPRGRTLTFQRDAQDVKVTFEEIDAQGKSTKQDGLLFNDGKFHPAPGVPAYDAQAYKAVNDSAGWVIRTKAGKVVQTLIGELSADGKTQTITTAGVTADGRQINDFSVYDKQ